MPQISSLYLVIPSRSLTPSPVWAHTESVWMVSGQLAHSMVTLKITSPDNWLTASLNFRALRDNVFSHVCPQVQGNVLRHLSIQRENEKQRMPWIHLFPSLGGFVKSIQPRTQDPSLVLDP